MSSGVGMISGPGGGAPGSTLLYGPGRTIVNAGPPKKRKRGRGLRYSTGMNARPRRGPALGAGLALAVLAVGVLDAGVAAPRAASVRRPPGRGPDRPPLLRP